MSLPLCCCSARSNCGVSASVAPAPTVIPKKSRRLIIDLPRGVAWFRSRSLPSWSSSVAVRAAGAAIVLAQQIAAEVTVEIAPDGVDMVRAVLRVVVFDEEAWSLDA